MYILLFYYFLNIETFIHFSENIITNCRKKNKKELSVFLYLYSILLSKNHKNLLYFSGIMFVLILLGITLNLANAYHHIDDIPIEHFNFEHGDPQNNAMDIELMPRFQKSVHISESVEDPKEYFFSSSYSQYGDNYYDGAPNSEEYSGEDDKKERIKREVIESPITTMAPAEENDRQSIVTTLGKPLELDVIDPENMTEKTEDGVIVAVESDESSNFLINDFIRFKRSAETERMAKDVANLKKLMDDIDEKNKRYVNFTGTNRYLKCLFIASN